MLKLRTGKNDRFKMAHRRGLRKMLYLCAHVPLPWRAEPSA